MRTTKKARKKLQLNRETLRLLDAKDLTRAAGGDPSGGGENSCYSRTNAHHPCEETTGC